MVDPEINPFILTVVSAKVSIRLGELPQMQGGGMFLRVTLRERSVLILRII